MKYKLICQGWKARSVVHLSFVKENALESRKLHIQECFSHFHGGNVRQKCA